MSAARRFSNGSGSSRGWSIRRQRLWRCGPDHLSWFNKDQAILLIKMVPTRDRLGRKSMRTFVKPILIASTLALVAACQQPQPAPPPVAAPPPPAAYVAPPPATWGTAGMQRRQARRKARRERREARREARRERRARRRGQVTPASTYTPSVPPAGGYAPSTPTPGYSPSGQPPTGYAPPPAR